MGGQTSPHPSESPVPSPINHAVRLMAFGCRLVGKKGPEGTERSDRQKGRTVGIRTGWVRECGLQAETYALTGRGRGRGTRAR